MAFQAGWGCCLLSFAAENQDAVRKHLRSFLDQLLAQRSVFGAVEFSLALGPAASRIGELPASAQAARRIAANRLTEGTGRLLEGIPKPSGLDRDRVLDQYRRQMERGMDGLDLQLLDKAVEELRRASCAVPHIQGWELLELTAAAGLLTWSTAQTAFEEGPLWNTAGRFICHTVSRSSGERWPVCC